MDARVGTLAIALTPVLVFGCGRGTLPNNNFGTLGDEIGESGSQTPTEGEGESSPDGTSATSSSDEISDESESTDAEGTTAETGTGTTTTTTSDGPDESTDDVDSLDTFDADGFETQDTWGVPPDVTNEPCEPLAQDCFPTHKCVPFATEPGSPFLDANKCMPIVGDHSWGEPCTLSDFNEAQDDCDGDGFCWNLEWVGGQLHGTCVPFCTGTPQDLMCPVGWGCLFSGALALCSKQCDPLLQDCPLDYGCYWAGNGFDCSLVGTPAGDQQACDSYNDCLPGYACVDKMAVPGCVGNDPNCCTPWCDLDGADPCPAPRACVPFFDEGEAPPGYADVGACILP